jgi:exodeoxyribonuclease-5
MVQYSTKQQQAIEDCINHLQNGNNVTLNGGPGVGKTTIIKGISDRLNVALAAPTHKAKNVLITKCNVTKGYTVAELLGLSADTDLEDFNPSLPKFAVKNEPAINAFKYVIIDEASMLSQEVVTKLEEYQHCTIMYVGDICQLPPVQKGESVSPVFKDNRTIITLTEIFRQSNDNPMLLFLHHMRSKILYHLGLKEEYEQTMALLNSLQSEFNVILNDNVLSSCIDLPTTGVSVMNQQEWSKSIIENFNKDNDIIVAYFNNRVTDINKRLHNYYYPNQLFGIGERLIAYKTLTESIEGKYAKRNETTLFNSTEYFVESVESGNREGIGGNWVKCKSQFGNTKVFVPLETHFCQQHKQKIVNAEVNREWKKYYEFKNKYALLNPIDKSLSGGKYDLAKDFDYGYCITSHKSQGSTYNNVWVDMLDISKMWSSFTKLTSLYVACSRASTKIYLLAK